MSLFNPLLSSTCDIYRQVADYDPATTEFGEIDAQWTLQDSGVACRLDIGSVPSFLRKTGLFESGRRTLYVEYDTNILKNDIISHSSGYYRAEDVREIEGYSGFHHKEISLTFIDENVPTLYS